MGNVLSPKPIVTLCSLNLRSPNNFPVPSIESDFYDGNVSTIASFLGTEFGVFILKMMKMTYSVSQSNDTMKWNDTREKSSLRAVEIALFSTSVLMVGNETDDFANEKHGKHLMIFRVSGMLQDTQVFKFRMMGQKDNMGKYASFFQMKNNH